LEGCDEGFELGCTDGCIEGWSEGCMEGGIDGWPWSVFVILDEGCDVGPVGDAVGL
jgi:hypothetical protein